MKDRIKFYLAAILFVLPGFGSLIFQKEVWPFSNYPMFSTSHKSRRFSAIKVYAELDKEIRQFENYDELFPLGPQCTVKLLLEDKVIKAKDYVPDLVRQNHLRIMSNYYRDRSVELFGEKPKAISIFFVSDDYSNNWRQPIENKKLVWREIFHE